MLLTLLQIAAWTAIAFAAAASLVTAPKIRLLYDALSPVIRQRDDSRVPQHLVHVVFFAFIGALFTFAYSTRFFLVPAALIAGIALLESLQNLIPGRHGDLPDTLWKIAGAAAGIGAAQMIQAL
jgi:hypothetical protein